jgi:hypothetical protein
MSVPNSTHEFFGVRVPFFAWLDVHGNEWRPGETRIELVPRPELSMRW